MEFQMHSWHLQLNVSDQNTRKLFLGGELLTVVTDGAEIGSSLAWLLWRQIFFLYPNYSLVGVNLSFICAFFLKQKKSKFGTIFLLSGYTIGTEWGLYLRISFCYISFFFSFQGKKQTEDPSTDTVDFPKRQTPAKGMASFAAGRTVAQRKQTCFVCTRWIWSFVR